MIAQGYGLDLSQSSLLGLQTMTTISNAIAYSSAIQGKSRSARSIEDINVSSLVSDSMHAANELIELTETVRESKSHHHAKRRGRGAPKYGVMVRVKKGVADDAVLTSDTLQSQVDSARDADHVELGLYDSHSNSMKIVDHDVNHAAMQLQAAKKDIN